ncbi:hypothetical protein HKBW3S06_00149 [Candidatus Hakubella thermalkaliphila]|uniref:Uncharacterized protein n=2 Tax=Candidatus Hakubella thermalkaliphila TaxID=2754717 RepID=A0A6V8NKS1_9ACTN|nr:hypothetical protein HKBW3S06_00149 [Candidatus Hakubella thermalkaliphila]
MEADKSPHQGAYQEDQEIAKNLYEEITCSYLQLISDTQSVLRALWEGGISYLSISHLPNPKGRSSST